MSKAQVRTDKWTIHKLYEEYFKPGKLIFNTEYQRSEVWGDERKQKLIDSIIKQYNLGMIFFRKINGTYEVLDGQQRLKSIFEFMENSYPTSPELTPEVGEIYFDQLKEDNIRYPRFIAFDINIAIVENADDETTSDIFLRLQEGMPLNTAEKLNAMRGKMRNVCLELSKHPFIKGTSINDHRFAHRLIAAQIFALEMKSDFESLSFSDINFENLKELYGKYSQKSPPGYILSNVKKYLNFLNRSFGEDASIIKRRGDFIPIYLLYSYLNKKYITQGIEIDFKKFTIDFLSKVENTSIQDTTIDVEDIPYRDFKRWRSAGALSSRSFRERFKIILGKFLERLPNMELKDEKRLFDYGQKLAIYYRDNGICQICHHKVQFDKSEVDHKVPWEKGGSTTVNNGQLTCGECNQKKGSN